MARPECTYNVCCCLCLSRTRIPLKSGLRLVGIPFCAAGQGLPPVDPAGFPSPSPPQRLGWGGEIPLLDSSPTPLPKDACEFGLRRMARLRCFKPCCGNGRRCTYGGRYATCQMFCVFDSSRSWLWNTTVRKIVSLSRADCIVWSRGSAR